MGIFDVDYNNAGTGQVAPGFYEVYVSDYQIGQSRAGNEIISLFYTVRDDINQPSRGGKLNYDNFNVIPSSKWRMDAFARAVGIPDGTSINSATEWANLMVNKDLIVKVVLGAPNDKGNAYPEVKEFHPTKNPNRGRPMPILEKAYGNNNHNQNDPHRPGDNNNFGGGYNPHSATNNVGNTGYGATNGYPANNTGNYANNVSNNQNIAMQNATDRIANHQQQEQQQNLGVDPTQDNRSFANGGFKNSINISDDDLPF